MSTLTMKQMAELKALYPEFGNLDLETLLKGIQRETLIKFATLHIGKISFTTSLRIIKLL